MKTRFRFHLEMHAMALAGAALVACGGAKGASEPRPEAADIGAEEAGPDRVSDRVSGVRLRVEPDDAEIFVNDELIGSAAELAARGGVIELSPGLHRITVKKAGYTTWRAEVAIRDRTETMEVVLEKSGR